MSPRRGDPRRIYEAARAGFTQRLITTERLTDRQAEQLLSSWELHAELSGIDRSSTHYWYKAERWISTQLEKP